MDETVQTADCPAESAEADAATSEPTPEDIVRLGRAMARLLFAAWRAGQDRDAQDSYAERTKRRAAG